MRRGFTLVELAIVLAVMSIVSVPAVSAIIHLKREAAAFQTIADLRTESRGAVSRIFARAKGGYQIQSDNAGLNFKDGSILRYENERLMLGGRSLIKYPVTAFTVVRRGKRLTVNLTLEAVPTRTGKKVQYRNIYDLEAGS
jgi:prepilin-type N-terminal cleavage/methylation domain-containing protein